MIWDTLSPFYDAFENVYNGQCNRGITEKISEYVTVDDVVLECACGTGLLTVPIAERCRVLIATDYSVGMLKQTQKKVASYKNTRLGKASILELPFRDDRFDVVVAANVIHLLDDPGKALSELKRVCKPGGRIVIPTYINNEQKNATLAAKLLKTVGVDFKRQFSLDSYKEFFDTHDVTVEEYSVVPGRMPCAFALIRN